MWPNTVTLALDLYMAVRHKVTVGLKVKKKKDFSNIIDTFLFLVLCV